MGRRFFARVTGWPQEPGGDDFSAPARRPGDQKAPLSVSKTRNNRHNAHNLSSLQSDPIPFSLKAQTRFFLKPERRGGSMKRPVIRLRCRVCSGEF